jgi:hypothetical protein
MIKKIRDNIWRFYPNTWEDWFWFFYSDYKMRLYEWWMWYSPPWSEWKVCPFCAGYGEEHHSFGGDVDVIDCSCCNGLGKIKKY